MTIEQQVLEKLRYLRPEKQKEVLTFVDSLKGESAPNTPRRSLLGLWADLNIDITAEDIAQARLHHRSNSPPSRRCARNL
jgi:EAL domain-containing protein (putative c-di-GMP-specific phosphodiesterase class I)